MSALPPEQSRSMREAAREDSTAQRALSVRWRTLHDRANRVARLAGLAPEAYDGEVAAFEHRIRDLDPARKELVSQTVGDIDAMLEPGLLALNTIANRGQDVTAPALSLWRAFFNARVAAMRLAPELPKHNAA